MGEAWIIDAVRTPRGKGKKDTGALSGIHPQELLAQCLNALQARNGFDPRDVEDMVAGCVSEVKLSDLDLIEINEAFAAIPLKVMKDLGMDPAKVNANGGAIALGHPLGATGAMLLGTVLDELERQDKTTGLVTMCIGGGMGIATIIERV
jgi:acetyl-CoA acetyltransferase